MHDAATRRIWPWAALACIVALYVITVFRFSPQYFFGATQDDSLYFSSAKALAHGQGYILPSVPGEPAATKYPILYPWLLSWVWRGDASFPANLTGAVALTVLFGSVFLLSCFYYFRELDGVGDTGAVALTFFVALHPIWLYYSGGVLSDVPFAALAFLAMLVGDQAMRPGSGDGKAIACGVLTGSSILMRAFGLPVAAGILAAAVARRSWRQAAIFCGALVPFSSAVVWRWMFVPAKVALLSDGRPLGPGFRNAWDYYTSYPAFWKLSVPNSHVLLAMLRSNVVLVLHSPSNYFLAPLLTRGSVWSLALMFLVTAGICAGVVRQSRAGGWKPIHWVFPFYMALVLIWNFPNTERFAILFLPLFAAGLWSEARHFLLLMYASFRKSKSRGEKAVATALALAVMAVIGALAWNYVRGARPVLTELAATRSSLLQEKLEAYEWISCCTSPTDIVIAYEDASLYLYSGRQSMRPVVFPTSGQYDATYLQTALNNMTDVAHAVSARYWLIADDDFDLESGQAAAHGRVRESEIARGLPAVFESHGGRVRIYRLSCGEPQGGQACP